MLYRFISKRELLTSTGWDYKQKASVFTYVNILIFQIKMIFKINIFVVDDKSFYSIRTESTDFTRRIV